MNKKEINTFIDFGGSKIRLGVINEKIPEKNYFIEKKIATNLDFENLNIKNISHVIREIIQTAEKKIDFHIKNLNLMLDISKLNSIDLSIKKNYEGKSISTEDIQKLLQESTQIVQKNNFDKKIIHIIVKKFFFDKNIFFEIPKENQKCKNLTIEIKFICFPSIILDNIKKIFNDNDILINNISCSTYIKSLYYNKFFDNHEKKIFLDIGFKKTCTAVFNKNILIHLNSIPIGGNHITKDISQVLKLTEENSEDIKKILNKTETTFSDNDQEVENLKENLEKINKDISPDLLMKVIHARIEEIINLSFKKINFTDSIKEDSYILIFTGNGSKILNNNAIYLEKKYHFINEMKFFEENLETICKSIHNFKHKNYINEVNFISKKPKKRGLFEKLFDLFS